MATFHLIKRNEYGESSIMKVSTDLTLLIKEAKKLTSSDNFDNPMTFDEQVRDSESYFVQFFDDEQNPIDSIVYGGKTGGGKDIFYSIEENGSVAQHNLSEYNLNYKFYLGEKQKGKTKEPVYAFTQRNKVINSMKDSFLEGKSVYFVQFKK